MQILYPRCAGLDVHQKTVVGCVRLVEGDQVTNQVRTFATTAKGLLDLAAWLVHNGCTHVAMEATGVYWRPVWQVLEAEFNANNLILANAHHIKNVPGRKTDVNDATWIAQLLAHGLIRSSFVPPPQIQQLRELTRDRKQMVAEQTRHVQRIHKLLEESSLKLATVLSDVMGKSGRAILSALVRGESEPVKLAALADRRVAASSEQLQEALRGNMTTSRRVRLQLHLNLYDELQRAIDKLDEQINEELRPFRTSYELLLTIPGVGETVAQVLVAEIGVDMTRFPTPGHLLSWGGLCPGHKESAGKRKSSRLRKGAPWLKAMLMQAAWAAVKVKKTYLRAQYLRLKGRMHIKKAIAAVAASMLKAVYYMLRDQVPYQDLGVDYFEKRKPGTKLLRLVNQIENLGLKVQMDPEAMGKLRIAA